MRATIYGKGWLGGKIAEELSGEYQVIKSNNDILDSLGIAQETLCLPPDIVVNAAGVCGVPNIDWCEASDDNKRFTRQTNAFGPRALLQTVRRNSDAYFVHLSSGCLWDVPDDHPLIDEEFLPAPVSFYSETKWEGERNLQGFGNVLIVRLRMPVDSVPNPRNLINKLRGYKKVLTVPNSVTFVSTLTRAIRFLIGKRATGIYHVVDGAFTGAEVMELYKEHVDPTHTFEPITLEELNAGLVSAKRSNCQLSNAKIQDLGFEFGPWYVGESNPARSTMIAAMKEYRKIEEHELSV